MDLGGGVIKDATATPSDVINGKIFYNNSGKQTGTLDTVQTTKQLIYIPKTTSSYQDDTINCYDAYYTNTNEKVFTIYGYNRNEFSSNIFTLINLENSIPLESLAYIKIEDKYLMDGLDSASNTRYYLFPIKSVSGTNVAISLGLLHLGAKICGMCIRFPRANLTLNAMTIEIHTFV